MVSAAQLDKKLDEVLVTIEGVASDLRDITSSGYDISDNPMLRKISERLRVSSEQVISITRGEA
jgi:hypothetical protein